jgi:hypothetical protein
MTSKYFICIRPQANDSHAVHKEGCPCLPEPRKRIFLGSFRSVHKAVGEGRKYFSMTCGCRFCSKEYYENSKKSISEAYKKSDFLTSERFKDKWGNALIYWMN